ncbi:RmlC-like cupin domain-containing protein [Exophiala viscosa]|uniref:RmlC-like cupin domain-containing protein n=1 Tax=Exophiala viscosa TaxID=2486360 RepID=A0AAN6IAF7_9EURO|nr:RmlC-like cupin domain-containing protein [Exophiala viscosa]
MMQFITSIVAILGGSSTNPSPVSGGLVVDTAPTTPHRPYVLPNLKGAAVDFGGLIIRTLVPNVTSSGGLSIVSVNSGPAALNLIHHHKEVEAFYALKGGVQVFHNSNQGRQLQANDFALLAPGNNHTYRPNDLDLQLTLCMAPGGIDEFFTSASNAYSSSGPFNPGHSSQLNITKVLGLMPQYNIIPEPFNTINTDWVNGTTEDGIDTWQVAEQTLPTDTSKPYFISSNRGPKYLSQDAGKVIAQLASPKQTNNKLSVATIAMKPGPKPAASRFNVDQAFQVTEGQLHVEINGERAQLIFGDLVFIPRGTYFNYWSTVGFTKFVAWSAGPGLSDSLIQGAEEWDYAVWPA